MHELCQEQDQHKGLAFQVLRNFACASITGWMHTDHEAIIL